MNKLIVAVRSLPVLLVLACTTSIAGAANASVDAIVVKFRGDEALAGVPMLPAGHRFLVVKALRTDVIEIGRSRDGGYRLALTPALPFSEAQEAINRLRLENEVLYVAHTTLAETPTRPRAQSKASAAEPLLHRMIVKYRTPNAIAAAQRGSPLAQDKLDRIVGLTGTPAAHERVMSGDAYVVRLFSRLPRVALEAAADLLEQDPDVEWAQPDYIDRIALTPNDPVYASQWHYFEPFGVNLPNAWNRTTGSSTIRVAVIDTGSLPNHPDLAGVFVGGYDMVSDSLFANDFDPPGCPSEPAAPCYNSRDADPSDPGDWITTSEDASGWFMLCGVKDSSWHGTHVAGTIGARTNNGLGVAGVNWVSNIVPVRALGKCGGYTSDIADAITWASGGTVPGAPANAYPAQVLNLSIAGERYNGTCDAPYQSAINDALTRNAVIVVAAGNESDYSYQYTPGNCAGVISVAATGRNGQRTKYTNYDNYQPQWTRIAIAAPGGSGSVTRPTAPLDYVFSTLNSGPVTPDPSGYTYGGMNGTSMAAPHVAGIVSLMLSVAPTKTPAQILSAIQTTARPFPTVLWENNCTSDLAKVNGFDPKYCGAGIIDADAAIAAVGPASPTTTALSSSLGLSAFGQNVTFTATVTGNSPTGTVTFSADAATVPGCGAVPLAAGIAQCSTPNLAVGVHTIGAAYAGDATHAPSSATPIGHTVVAAVAPKQRDFNADFKADLLWRANVGGSHAIWLMNGIVATGAAAIGLTMPRQVTHTADFNADNRYDLLVRDTVAGTTSIWLMNGIVSTSAATLLADPNWTATHTGDFNGDGNADIVWRHAPTGTTSLWLMNGTAMATGATLLVSTAWQVVQVADFDGDGKADLLWRNASTGESAIWLMNGGLFVSGSVVLASTAWSPILTGDFDGNGRADIVWRNASTGQTAIWLMNGLSMASGAIVLANTSWEPTHVADFDGNGKSDIVWRNVSTGDTSVWLMNGLAMASGGSITNAGSAVVTTGDYDGNGKADIVWHNSATGATEMRLMNGLAVSAAAVLLVSTDWSVRP